MSLCPECASDLDLGHGHALDCRIPLRRLWTTVLRGGWTDEELAERKREGIGGGAPRSDTQQRPRL